MSARTTPDGRGSATSSPRLYPPPAPTPSAMVGMAAQADLDQPGAPRTPAPGSVGVAAPIGRPETDTRAEPRRALRAARRQRRQVMVGCALVIAVCLVLTILIVTIARGRRPGSGVVVADIALVQNATAPGAGVSAAPLILNRHTVNPDAAASEGEHR